jgi:hypothetical protein
MSILNKLVIPFPITFYLLNSRVFFETGSHYVTQDVFQQARDPSVSKVLGLQACITMLGCHFTFLLLAYISTRYTISYFFFKFVYCLSSQPKCKLHEGKDLVLITALVQCLKMVPG